MLGLLCLLHRHADKNNIVDFFLGGGGGGGGYVFTILTSPKKPSRFPVLQSMEFVVDISNTEQCIQIMKDTDNFVDIMKMLLLLKKVLTHHVEEQHPNRTPPLSQQRML